MVVGVSGSITRVLIPSPSSSLLVQTKVGLYFVVGNGAVVGGKAAVGAIAVDSAAGLPELPAQSNLNSRGDTSLTSGDHRLHQLAGVFSQNSLSIIELSHTYHEWNIVASNFIGLS
jgi:hypothetical protein